MSRNYRAAYLPLYGSPVEPRLVEAFDKEATAFHKAALMTSPVEAVEIPYEETTLPSATLRFWSGAEPSFSTSKSRNFSVELPQLIASTLIETILR